MVVKARKKELKDSELYRNGDGAVAAILAWYASLHLPRAIEFMALPTAEELGMCVDDYEGWFCKAGG